jgi:hypothetical protein
LKKVSERKFSPAGGKSIFVAKLAFQTVRLSKKFAHFSGGNRPKNMPIVTLTTDFGTADFYVGALKGALLSACPEATVVDIAHDLRPFDIVRAAFVLRQCWREFPEGTIHLVSVNHFADVAPRFVALRHESHYFIGPDNGLFSLCFGELPTEIYQLEMRGNDSFFIKKMFAEAVAHIADGRAFDEIGTLAEEVMQRIHLQPVVYPNAIRGTVIFIDRYGNATTNISAALFEGVRQDRQFTVHFKRHEPLRRISRFYTEAATGEPLCLFNSAGLLEIAINMGNAAALFDLALDDTVQVEFG